MINDVIVSLLLLCGGSLMLLAGIGVVRMPDVYMRVSAAAKASTLGAGCLLLAVAVHFDMTHMTARALAVLAFIFITAPVGGHMICRAAYLYGVPLWAGSVTDQLSGRYEQHTHRLRSLPPEALAEGTPTSGDANRPSS